VREEPGARRTGEECVLAAGESVARTTPGDDDQSGIVFVRRWTVK